MAKTISIQSHVHNICKIEHFLNNVFKELKFSRKIYCKLYLSTIEAVNNAIIHGNSCDINKKVNVKLSDLLNRIVVEIKDEGDGFKYESVSDPTQPNNIKKESGRGIFIMKQYADQIKYNESGNKVKLIFNK